MIADSHKHCRVGDATISVTITVCVSGEFGARDGVESSNGVDWGKGGARRRSVR